MRTAFIRHGNMTQASSLKPICGNTTTDSYKTAYSTTGITATLTKLPISTIEATLRGS